MRLIDAPVGLFLWNGQMCLKTKYTEEWGVEAYIVSSGETFWGDATTASERNKLEVTPIEAEPVRHGRWVKTEEPLGWQEVDCVECSVCHESWIANEDYGFDFLDFWKCCPNCGAKMDGGADT